MNKEVFSMYATRPRNFFLHECNFPNHEETELSALISSSVVRDLSLGLDSCMVDISRIVIKGSSSYVELPKKGRAS